MQGACAVVTIDDWMRILIPKISKNVHVDANGDNDEEDELDYLSQFACTEAMQMHCMNSFNRITCQFWILHIQYNQ